MNRLCIGFFFFLLSSLAIHSMEEKDDKLSQTLDSMHKSADKIFVDKCAQIQTALSAAYKEEALFRNGTNMVATGSALAGIGICLGGISSWKHLVKCMNENEGAAEILKPLVKNQLQGLTGLIFTSAGGVCTSLGALMLIHYGIEKVIEDDLDIELKEEKRQREIAKEPLITIHH